MPSVLLNTATEMNTLRRSRPIAWNAAAGAGESPGYQLGSGDQRRAAKPALSAIGYRWLLLYSSSANRPVANSAFCSALRCQLLGGSAVKAITRFRRYPGVWDHDCIRRSSYVRATRDDEG